MIIFTKGFKAILTKRKMFKTRIEHQTPRIVGQELCHYHEDNGQLNISHLCMLVKLKLCNYHLK